MARPEWAPEGIDIDHPSAARMYDYLLGGNHNFAVDRKAVERALAVMPDLAVHTQANRAFLYRAVRSMLDAGVRQFLDIGSGVPTVGNVHEVAQRVDPEARVVYVDIDPVAVTHSRSILAGNPYATVVQEDLRRPEEILRNPAVRELLDLDQPVGLLLVAILHAVPDGDDPHGLVERLSSQLVPGSYLAISHGTADGLRELVETLAKQAADNRYPLSLRDRAGVLRFFTGFELVDPGLVWLSLWRPDDPDDIPVQPERSGNYAGVGRKS
jgi:SAM-dependent methyltransferase